jgi:hypothetical protein
MESFRVPRTVLRRVGGEVHREALGIENGDFVTLQLDPGAPPGYERVPDGFGLCARAGQAEVKLDQEIAISAGTVAEPALLVYDAPDVVDSQRLTDVAVSKLRQRVACLGPVSRSHEQVDVHVDPLLTGPIEELGECWTLQQKGLYLAPAEAFEHLDRGGVQV